MTNTNTMDTAATVKQTIALYEAGCEMVRITAPGVKEAENLEAIKNSLLRQGYDIPLIADIHFNPKAAETAAAIVEKVRINPGNYTDRNTGKVNFTDQEYAAAVERIRQRIGPLVDICKQNHTAMRIGSNHGSLSERIVDRYGDTPAGMVESALEFVRICHEMDFYDLVLSMKASNVRVMIYATRLLVQKMTEEGMSHPVHLGVTEAGDGSDGRIKSALGIGTLLADGIGDTIRVSLTEDPVNEIPAAKQIAGYFKNIPTHESSDIFSRFFYNPFDYEPRKSNRRPFAGITQFPVVAGEKEKSDTPADYSPEELLTLPGWRHITGMENARKFLAEPAGGGIVYESTSQEAVFEFRQLFSLLNDAGADHPVILKKDYSGIDKDQLIIRAAIDFGPLFADGLADGMLIGHSGLPFSQTTALAFQILQAAGARISKTEFIACPSCGRTLYDIQKTLGEIKTRLSHLKGLKIAVMGCIVNGPGEMADADYGYVGMGAGKVALFKGKEMVRKGIGENRAVDELIRLIKANGDWREA